jgi:hypothetical protein
MNLEAITAILFLSLGTIACDGSISKHICVTVPHEFRMTKMTELSASNNCVKTIIHRTLKLSP